MPITVDFPTPNHSFGHGWYYQCELTDAPPDAIVVISMFDDLGREVLRNINPQGQGVGFRTGKMGEQYAFGFGMEWLQESWTGGQPAFCRFQAFEPSGALVTSTSVPVIWENEEGTLVGLQSVTQGGAGSGFTSADRQMLRDVAAAVQVSVPLNSGIGDIVNVGLGQLWNLIPGGLMVPSPPQILTGRGSLPGSGTFASRFYLGATWQFFTVPEHYGKHDGVTTEWEQRLMQINLVNPDGENNLFVRDTRDIDTSGWYWTWGLPAPARIDYDIAPGVVVSLELLSIVAIPTPHGAQPA